MFLFFFVLWQWRGNLPLTLCISILWSRRMVVMVAV
jgi:hypothetical protein